jgi:hypothetical protein
MRRLGLAAVALLLLAGCSGSGAGSPPASSGGSSSASGSVRTVSLARLANAHPTQRADATILIGFDAASAAAMVTPAPPIDFASQALLCLHIGERATGGWSVTIQSISLDGSGMKILAREVEPRPGTGTTQAFSYPADCAVIDRTALPVGQLAVRADDTTSDEFIVDAVVQVPAR